MALKYILLLVSYLIGAIPFSIIFGKLFKGIDVRLHGSGNPGGTNSLRFLGVPVGSLIIFVDVLKGAIIIILIKAGVFDGYDLFHPLAYSLIAAFGHAYSVFIKFKGGKAVGTTYGGILAFNPIFALVIAIVASITLKLTKYVSIGSTAIALTFIVCALVIGDYEVLLFATLSAALIIFRHQGNYRNIRNKVEPKVKWL